MVTLTPRDVGLTAIPTGLMTTILRRPQDDEKAKVLIRWTPVKTTNKDELVIYIIEECHHYGKLFLPARLTKWSEWKRTSHTSAEYKNIGELGKWFQFRISAVNENGTLGPSVPSSPLYASSLPKVPRAPDSLKVSATSWGNGRLHLLLTWLKPESEAPIDRYKVTWSILKNLTLSEHHYTLPSVII
ncbi:hypothetical protein V9T40_011024 [Parthenolecanium corni]|uniref:Fibronectin type-III domain-containing protein n=1 Tax=Parthenolecanium corni TaxID=536013 RepID=A0AAN9T4Q6_9HEMI